MTQINEAPTQSAAPGSTEASAACEAEKQRRRKRARRRSCNAKHQLISYLHRNQDKTSQAKLVITQAADAQKHSDFSSNVSQQSALKVCSLSLFISHNPTYFVSPVFIVLALSLVFSCFIL